mgnify:FL=1
MQEKLEIGARSELNAICCHTTSKSASKFSWIDAFGKIPWSYLLTHMHYCMVSLKYLGHRTFSVAILKRKRVDLTRKIAQNCAVLKSPNQS